MRPWMIPVVALCLGVSACATEFAVAQYINGPVPPVTAGQFCAEMRGWVGMERQGHRLRSISCSGSGHDFTVHVRID